MPAGSVPTSPGPGERHLGPSWFLLSPLHSALHGEAPQATPGPGSPEPTFETWLSDLGKPHPWALVFPWCNLRIALSACKGCSPRGPRAGAAAEQDGRLRHLLSPQARPPLPGGHLLLPHGLLHGGLRGQVRPPPPPPGAAPLPACCGLLFRGAGGGSGRPGRPLEPWTPGRPQPGQPAAVWDHLRGQPGGGGQGEHHERGGGLHGRRQDHRQRADHVPVRAARAPAGAARAPAFHPGLRALIPRNAHVPSGPPRPEPRPPPQHPRSIRAPHPRPRPPRQHSIRSWLPRGPPHVPVTAPR